LFPLCVGVSCDCCIIYVPFGGQWFPYFMRRLGERPANVAFVMRGIFQER
jgi:proline dehydrogenase